MKNANNKFVIATGYGGNHSNNVLNSDERQHLFNTFMKEMTMSLHG
jgi:hypothetical protein